MFKKFGCAETESFDEVICAESFEEEYSLKVEVLLGAGGSCGGHPRFGNRTTELVRSAPLNRSSRSSYCCRHPRHCHQHYCHDFWQPNN